MAAARFRVLFAGPLVSFQDGGRFGHKRFGVPASGPMDRLSHGAANVALGNPSTATAVEISMGGLMLECLSGSVTLAVTGGTFSVEHAGHRTPSWTALTVQAGDKVSIRPGADGSWAYMAVCGQLMTPKWLGHSATHSLSGFGGGSLTSAQEFTVENATVSPAREGDIARPDFADLNGTARVVMGPQDQHFTSDAIHKFQTTQFELTAAFDRMGLRLSGPTLALKEALSIPSEPVLRGSIQVAGDGVPTVLLADHQTTGGYPKIATVIGDDVGKIAQLRAGDGLRFSAISPAEAIALARDTAAKSAAYYSAIATPRGTLNQRLMDANLISGVVSAQDH